jgi:hypothetical protein
LQEFHPYVFQILAQLIELSSPPLSAVSCSRAMLGRAVLYHMHCGLFSNLLALANLIAAVLRYAYHLSAQVAQCLCLPSEKSSLLLFTDVLYLVCCALLVLQPYMAVFPPLLNPMFWERPGNVPALTRLLVAYLAKAGQELTAAGGDQRHSECKEQQQQLWGGVTEIL